MAQITKEWRIAFGGHTRPLGVTLRIALGGLDPRDGRSGVSKQFRAVRATEIRRKIDDDNAFEFP
ncbi:unannotated protein [freshwater metagenome]|uniref:Unannotated protein n=1 Tax=freshwater metagenome TaxID=449393 RepID=A0A6J6XSX6_9ZZZZ